MPILKSYTSIKSANHRRAAMRAMCVIMHGCAGYMRELTTEFLPLLYSGLRDKQHIVRREACWALQAVAEGMPMELAANHETVMPLLLDALNDLNNDTQFAACACLDDLLCALEANVVPYLPLLMKRLTELAEKSRDEDVAAAAIFATANVADASGQEFKPYFEDVIRYIVHFMTRGKPGDDSLLRGAATATGGAIASAVGTDMFSPYLEDLMDIAIKQLNFGDHYLRQCSYAFFATMANVLGQDFGPYLSEIMYRLFDSCRFDGGDEGKETQSAKEYRTTADYYDNGSDEEDDPEDYFDDCSSTASSTKPEETELAIDALGQLFESTKTEFLPYAEESVETLVVAIGHSSAGVRKAAVASLFAHLKTFHLLASGEDPWVPGLPIRYNVDISVRYMINSVMPYIIATLEDEKSAKVATEICKEFTFALTVMGPCLVEDRKNYVKRVHDRLLVLYARYLDSEEISERIFEILDKRATCQQVYYDVKGALELEEDIEEETALVSAATGLVVMICKALRNAYSLRLAEFIPLIARYYASTRAIEKEKMIFCN